MRVNVPAPASRVFQAFLASIFYFLNIVSLTKVIWLDSPSTLMQIPTRHITLLVVLAALCIGIQLTPRPIPNVESTSLLVFLTGAVFGIFFGVSLGVLVMSVNGFFSAYGFAGLILPFQIVGMIVIGVAGALYGHLSGGKHGAASFLEVAILGAFLTVIYDFVTNFAITVPSILAGQPFPAALVPVLISGAMFSAIHVVSNAILFFVAFVPLRYAVQNLLGGELAWKREFSLT